MLEATKYFPDYQFIVAKAPSIENEFYDQFLQEYENVKTESDSTYSILMKSTAALVTSGTATLETALFKIPEIVCYKAGKISYEIGKRLIKLKYISLVNLIMNKEVVKELIQDDLTPEKIKVNLHDILFNDRKKSQIMKDYDELESLLSKGGDASKNAAEIIWELVKK